MVEFQWLNAQGLNTSTENHFSKESFDRYSKYFGKAMIESSDGSLRVFDEDSLNARLEELRTAEDGVNTYDKPDQVLTGSALSWNETIPALQKRYDEMRIAESQPVSIPGVSDEEIRTILLGELDMWSKRSPEVAKRVAQVLIDTLKAQYEL